MAAPRTPENDISRHHTRLSSRGIEKIWSQILTLLPLLRPTGRRAAHRRRQGASGRAGTRGWRTVAAAGARRADTVRRLRSGGPTAADRPDRVATYLAREESKRLAYLRAGVTDSYFRERKIGPTLDLDDYPPTDTARIAGVPVGRIVNISDRGEALDGFATGFIVVTGAAELAMTNHHVFSTAAECTGCGIQFAYEYVDGHIHDGPVYAFDPTRFFYTNEKLDCTIVGVTLAALGDGTPLAQFRSVHMSPAVGKILVGQSVSIIQYPDGGPKKYGVRDNELLVPAEPSEVFLQDTTHTLPGSSGSPAFNQDWELIALHHSGVPEVKDGNIITIRGDVWRKGMPDSDIHWVANEGVRVSSICEALITAQIDDSHRDEWASLIQTFQEDFSMMPILQTPAPDTGVGPAMTTIDPKRGVSIVVNGTANFYIGEASQSPNATPDVTPPGAVAPSSAQEKKLVFDPDYKSRPGYKPNFLKVSVPLPGVKKERTGELLAVNGKPLVLKYHHYSLVLNQLRRLQMWSAVNVDYAASKRRKTREEFGTDTWVADPRIAGELQIEDQQLYDPAKKFDRGHIVRRDDTAWGTPSRKRCSRIPTASTGPTARRSTSSSIATCINTTACGDRSSTTFKRRRRTSGSGCRSSPARFSTISTTSSTISAEARCSCRCASGKSLS